MIDVSKIILVAGPGGSRLDFTAGWLGKLPNFIDSNWNINIASGRSHGFMGFSKSLDFSNNLQNILQDVNIQITAESKLSCVGAMHGNNTSTYDEFVKKGLAEILQIDVSGAPSSTIIWEFFAKTYLSSDNSHHAYNNKHRWLIDNYINKTSITDQDRIDKIHQYLKHTPKTVSNIDLKDLKHVKVSYNKIFQPGGSFLITKALNLDVDKKYHDYWDAMLPFAKSPNIIDVFGCQWKKEDYFSD